MGALFLIPPLYPHVLVKKYCMASGLMFRIMRINLVAHLLGSLKNIPGDNESVYLLKYGCLNLGLRFLFLFPVMDNVAVDA